MCFMHTVTALLLLFFSLNLEHDSISEGKEDLFFYNFFVRIIVWLESKQPFSLFLSVFFFNISRFIFSCLPFHFILTIFWQSLLYIVDYYFLWIFFSIYIPLFILFSLFCLSCFAAGHYLDAQPNRILLVTIQHMLYPITVDVLHQVFSPHGFVEKIVTFQKSAGQPLQVFSLSSFVSLYITFVLQLDGSMLFCGKEPC